MENEIVAAAQESGAGLELVEFKVDMSFSAEEIAGFLEAVRFLLGEKNTLFETMVNKLYELPELKEIIYEILFSGKESSYNALNQVIGTTEMLGFIKNANGVVAIANRIFETVFYDLFLTSAEA